MGSTIKVSMLLAGAGLLCAAGTARASELPVMNVRVPFAFVVNGQTLPAGQYRIEEDQDEPSMLFIRGTGHNEMMVVATIPASGVDPSGTKPALTFTRNGSQYQLSSVWGPDEDGRALVR